MASTAEKLLEQLQEAHAKYGPRCWTLFHHECDPILQKLREQRPGLLRYRTRPWGIEWGLRVPKILDKAVQKIERRGVPKSSAYPIAVSALQKAGDLRSGSLKATRKGTKRGQMTAAERAKTR